MRTVNCASATDPGQKRVQLCSSYEPVLWFTNDASKVRSNNLHVLQPHSKQHLKLQAAGGENRTTCYGDGAYQLKSGSFGNKTEGTIPKNTLFYGSSCADTRFCHSIARELGFPLHGATSPTRLASFLIEFLTAPGNFVVDPFSHLDLFLALTWEKRILWGIFIVMRAWLNFPEWTPVNRLWAALVYDILYILDMCRHNSQ